MDFSYLKHVSQGHDKNEVLQDLMVEYGQDVWNFAFSLTGHPNIADDIRQEVFVKAFNRLETYRGQSSVKTWLLAITRNAVTDYHRSAFFRKVTLVDYIKETGEHPSAEQQYLDSQKIDDVWKAVMSLPILPTDPARSDRGQNIVAPMQNLGWMLNDLKLWSLKNNEVYLSRKVNVVEGALAKDMAEKFQASKYKLWIDEATGMLLKKQLFNRNDVVTESFVVTSIQVDQRLDKGVFDVPTDLKATQQQSSFQVPSFPKNENGQTYGSASDATSPETEPDLIKAHS